ncbi:MAG: AbrB/MazE/SpoVT family DNA-binding domain-containing protein [Lachnospiraceae bacterium]
MNHAYLKSTGIVRRLDELGRITLPIELRRTLDIGEKDPVEIYVSEDMIILRKYEPSDTFTGSRENLYEFHGKMVSKESITELAKIAGLID